MEGIRVFLNKQLELINASDPEREIEFEDACMKGKHKIVKKMLDECPSLSANKDYLRVQIDFVKEERKSIGRKKVLELLTQRL